MTAQALSTAIGSISGTSMDGIDVSLVRSDGETHVEPGPRRSAAPCSTSSPTLSAPRPTRSRSLRRR
jgi:anhydro-N-acetylmuramic acid kinase